VIVLVLLLFIAAVGVVMWAGYAAVTGRIAGWVSACFLVALLGCGVAAYFTTFRYTYFINANTRIHGWPVPIVIFQRTAAGEPWLDYVGSTSLLAYPLNLVLFMVLPALGVVVGGRLRKKEGVAIS